MVQKQKSNHGNKVEKAKRQIVQHHVEYSGIIPPPNIIEGYEKNCPGATDRILAMTENELKHKQELERMEQKSIMECREKMLESEMENFKRGQILGFIIMIIALFGSFVLILTGHEAGGYTTAIGIVLFYFASVMYRHKVRKQNSENKE